MGASPRGLDAQRLIPWTNRLPGQQTSVRPPAIVHFPNSAWLVRYLGCCFLPGPDLDNRPSRRHIVLAWTAGPDAPRPEPALGFGAPVPGPASRRINPRPLEALPAQFAYSGQPPRRIVPALALRAPAARHRQKCLGPALAPTTRNAPVWLSIQTSCCCDNRPAN